MPAAHAASHHAPRARQPELVGEVTPQSPRRPRASIRRPALIRTLTSPDPAALVLLVAPPGYGKSTLLAEWSERDARDFIWLGREGLDLAEVVRTARSKRREFVVVLDDAQLIGRARLAAMIRAALPELPPGSTLAVASRTEPDLALGRLRANRCLTEIRIQHLRMSPGEGAQLLMREGARLPAEQREGLLAATEGWPAALYLAAWALHEDASCVETLPSRHHMITEYLQDEVLGALQGDLRSFALRTSVLEELSGEACDFVLDQPGSARLLDQLTRATPLLVPTEPSREHYRWHRLVRDALRLELHRTDPVLEAALHRSASGWFAQIGSPREAIDHATQAGDVDLAEELMWRHMIGYASSGESQLVAGWLSRLGPERISRGPRLALCAALNSLISGELSEARRWVTASAAAAERSQAPDSDEWLAARLVAGDATSDWTDATAVAELSRLVETTEPVDSQWRPLCLLFQGMAAHLRGDRQQAEQLLEQGIVLGAEATPAVTTLCLAQLGMIAIEESDWERAEEFADRAIGAIAGTALAEEPICALTYAVAAASRAHQGRIDEAKAAIRTSTDLLTSLRDFVPCYGAEVRILMAHASLALADIARARALLAEASRLARRTPDAVIFGHWFDDAWAYMDTLAETSLAGPSSLTIAELRILRFLPSHRSFREIAAQLDVSANTVKTQAHAVYRKLGAASRSEAVARALSAGLLLQ